MISAEDFVLRSLPALGGRNAIIRVECHGRCFVWSGLRLESRVLLFDLLDLRGLNFLAASTNSPLLFRHRSVCSSCACCSTCCRRCTGCRSRGCSSARCWRRRFRRSFTARFCTFLAVL